MFRRFAQFLAGVLLLLFIVWLSWPLWSLPVARLVAKDAGIELLDFHSRRPRLDGVHIERLRARADTIGVEVEGAQVGWTWAGLRVGRLAAVEMERMLVRLSGEMEAAGASDTPLDSNVVPRLPVDRLLIADLAFHAPGLPLRMQGDFRLEQRVIQLRMTATESPAGIPVRLTVRLDDQGRFLARFHSSEDKDVHALEAHGAMANGVLDIEGALDLRDYELRLITGLSGITPMGGRLTGPVRATFDEHFNLRRAEILPVVSLQAESEQGRRRRFSLEGRIAWDSGDDGVGEVAIALTDTSVSQSTAIDTRVRLSPDRIDADGTFSLSRSDFSSLMALVDLTDIEGGGRGDFRLAAPLPFDVDAVEVDATVALDLRYEQATTLRLQSLGLVHQPRQSWAFNASGIEFRQDDEGAVTTFAAPAVAGEISGVDAPSIRFTTRGDASLEEDELHLVAKSMDITGTVNRIESGWTLLFDIGWRNQKLVLSVDADEAFDSLAFEAPVDWRLREPLLARMLGMKTEYDVIAGRFAGTVKGSIRGDITRARVQGVFKQGRLAYGAHEASDVSAIVNYVLSSDGRHTVSLDDVLIGGFDPGVPITEIRTSLRLDDRTVDVGNSSARILGGTVTTSPFIYTIDPGDATFDVVVRAIDLGAVLALEGEDLDGTGTLEGTLPIRVEAGAVTVRKGTIRNVGTGVIRVAPDLTRVVNQPGLDFALRALEDFRYTSLEAVVDYDAKGDLLAAIRLQGRNPAIEKGRPIHYNLNISENIPSLLASLRIQDDVNERIERRVRAGTRSGAQPGTGRGASE